MIFNSFFIKKAQRSKCDNLVIKIKKLKSAQYKKSIRYFNLRNTVTYVRIKIVLPLSASG